MILGGRNPFALAVVIGLVLTGCAGDPEPDASATAVADSFQSCGPIERPPLQGGTHLIGDADPPEPWSSTPGTSGWHSSDIPTGVETEPVGDADIVAALEAGIVILAYDPTADVDTNGFNHLVEESAGRLAVVPYAGEMPSPITLLAWGRLSRCPVADFADITSFLVTQTGRGRGHTST